MQKQIQKKEKYRIDWCLLFLVCILTVIGLWMLFSTAGGVSRRWVMQLIAAGIGIVLFITISFVDLRMAAGYRKTMYIGCILALAAVLLFGIGKEQTGASSWIRIGPVGIQPSEPVKVLFAVLFAEIIAEAGRKNTWNRPKNLFGIVLLFVPFFSLIVFQNDTGTALVYLFMFLVMLFAGGLGVRYFVGGLLAILPVIPAVWFCLAPYQQNRILVFFRPETDPSGSGYQVLQSKLSVASGGVSGRGWMQGIYNRLSLLPEKETDFIFGVIGEELGFIGSVAVVVLLFLLCLRCFAIGANAATKQGRILSAGIGAMFLFHITENIGMCLGLLPVTGIPLPFISYGGSFFITCWLAAGVMQNVYAETETFRFYYN